MDDTTAASSSTESAPVADTAPQAVDAAPVESGLEAPAGGDDGLSPSAGEAAAPTDAATARSHALIREHFGLEPTILQGMTPEAVQALAARAESALIDQFASKATPPPSQAQPPAATPPAADAAPQSPLNVDLAPFLEELEAEYGEPAARTMGGALQAIVQAFGQQLQPLMAMQQAFQPIAESWQEHTAAQTNQRIEGFFSNLVKSEPVWAEHYKTPEAKSKVVEMAVQLKGAAAQAGHQLTGEQALLRAHLALSREFTNKQAIDSVRAQVAKRSRQITTPPGMAATSGRPQGDTAGDWRSRAIAELEPVVQSIRSEIGV